MLTYLATYPRCGSGVLRQALSLNFGYPTANAYAASGQQEPGPDDALALSRGRLMVREPALEALTIDARRRLAARPDRFFVKTHERPFDEWFDGESVIQMVRHPCPAIVSHYLLSKKRPLADHIAGRCISGSWSEFHEAWRKAPVPTLRLRYEDVYRQSDALLAPIERFTGLQRIKAETETPEQASLRNPKRNPGRGLDGWKSDLSEADAALIWALHGREAEFYFYNKDGATALEGDGPHTSPDDLLN